MSAREPSRTIHCIPLAEQVLWKDRRCRNCCDISARTALNTTLPLISPPLRHRCTKPQRNIWTGRCTGINKRLVLSRNQGGRILQSLIEEFCHHAKGHRLFHPAC